MRFGLGGEPVDEQVIDGVSTYAPDSSFCDLEVGERAHAIAVTISARSDELPWDGERIVELLRRGGACPSVMRWQPRLVD